MHIEKIMTIFQFVIIFYYAFQMSSIHACLASMPSKFLTIRSYDFIISWTARVLDWKMLLQEIRLLKRKHLRRFPSNLMS
jgi:hypothetical protein